MAFTTLTYEKTGHVARITLNRPEVLNAITRDIVNRINQEVLKALQLPEVRERLASLGAEPFTMTPEQFDAYIRDELAANAKVVKAAGVKVN